MTGCNFTIKLPVYFLAGGKSRRFGSDKARAVLAGLPLITRLVEMLSSRATYITVIADAADKYADLGYKTLADIQPGLGPLGGIQTALADYRLQQSNHNTNDYSIGNGWLLVVSCDWVEIRAGWIETLLKAALSLSESDMNGQFEAIAFSHSMRRDKRDLSSGHVWEPLLALYNIVVAERVDRHIAQKRLSMHELLNESRTYGLVIPEDWPVLSQVNTVEDLERVQL